MDVIPPPSFNAHYPQLRFKTTAEAPEKKNKNSTKEFTNYISHGQCSCSSARLFFNVTHLFIYPVICNLEFIFTYICTYFFQHGLSSLTHFACEQTTGLNKLVSLQSLVTQTWVWMERCCLCICMCLRYGHDNRGFCGVAYYSDTTEHIIL